jgi:hypothetical protein
MSQEPQAEVGARLDEPAVVEFGADEPVRERPRASHILTAVRRDWRLVPIIAGLSAVALFASMVGEWQITTFTQPDLFSPGQTPPLSVGLADMGAFATGYLIGVFALVTCMALVLFGRPAMRDQLRIVGLTVAGVSGALLIGAAVWLDGRSAAIPSTFLIGQQGPIVELAYGRGLTMAFLGVAGFALALYLAGRLMPAPPAQPAVAAAGVDTGPAPQAEPVEPVDWPWRRPRVAREPDDVDSDLPPPADLTVGPTAPFLPMPDGNAAMPDGKRDATNT